MCLSWREENIYSKRFHIMVVECKFFKKETNLRDTNSSLFEEILRAISTVDIWCFSFIIAKIFHGFIFELVRSYSKQKNNRG